MNVHAINVFSEDGVGPYHEADGVALETRPQIQPSAESSVDLSRVSNHSMLLGVSQAKSN
jgi:hypothetical protein